MELKLFEDFLCLAQKRSFSQAAAERNITQSALSKRIKMLEGWLGAELVNRSSHPVTLTEQGAAALAQSREIVHLIQGLRSSVETFDKLPPNAILIGAPHTLMVTFLPAWRAAIENRIGPITFGPIIQDTDYLTLLTAFKKGSADFLLAYRHASVPIEDLVEEGHLLLLAREKLIPVSVPLPSGAPAHALRAGSKTQVIGYGDKALFQRALQAKLEERPAVLHEVASNAMCVGQRSMVLVGTGLAWLPESLVRRDLKEGRLVRGGGREWDLSLDVVLMHKPSKRLAANVFWRAAQEIIPHTQALLGQTVML